jgi:hypothetical protein
VQHESALYWGHLVLPSGILPLVELFQQVPADADPITNKTNETK